MEVNLGLRYTVWPMGLSFKIKPVCCFSHRMGLNSRQQSPSGPRWQVLTLSGLRHKQLGSLTRGGEYSGPLLLPVHWWFLFEKSMGWMEMRTLSILLLLEPHYQFQRPLSASYCLRQQNANVIHTEIMKGGLENGTENAYPCPTPCKWHIIKARVTPGILWMSINRLKYGQCWNLQCIVSWGLGS